MSARKGSVLTGLALFAVLLVSALVVVPDSGKTEAAAVDPSVYSRVTTREHIGVGANAKTYVETETVTIRRRP